MNKILWSFGFAAGIYFALAGSALAALTLGSTSVSSDGILTLTGTTASAWDLGGAPLDLQSTGGFVGIGTSTPLFTLDVNGKIGVSGTQFIYLPNQASFAGSLVIGNGGANLLHVSGSDGNGNTFVGLGIGGSNTIGNFNTASGYDALYSNTTGSRNTAFGYATLSSNTTGIWNTAVGSQALNGNTTGNFNIAIGKVAMPQNTTGTENVAVGVQALLSNTTGSYNNTVGNDSQYTSTSTSYNNSIGDSTLTNNIGTGNTAIGNHGLVNNTTGNYNVSFGYNAGTSITTGSNNIVIGTYADVPDGTASNQLNIGNVLYGNSTTGSIGINTSTPIANFQVANGTNATTTAEFGSSGQNKGTCIKLYRADGSAIYASVGTGATAFTLSTAPCASVTGF